MRRHLWGRCGVGGHKIAEIADAVAEIAERLGEAGGAVGIGAHEAAAPVLAAIDGGADQNDCLGGHHMLALLRFAEDAAETA